MIKAGIELRDIEGFDAQFEEVYDAVNANLEQVADFVLAEAQRSTEFIDRSGSLRKSIKKRPSKYKDGGFIVFAKGGNKKKGYHAHLVEFGHVQIPPGDLPGKRVPPHPFLRPALAKSIGLALTLFRDKK